jgi:hypothetical protein
VQIYVPGQDSPMLEQSLTTDAQGSFQLPGIPEGTYLVRVKHPHAVSRQSAPVTFSSATAASSSLANSLTAVNLNFGALLPGDANDDDHVDIVDFSLLRASFGSQTICTTRLPPALPCSDFDATGSVDIVDFSLLRSSFGRDGPLAVE